MAPIRFIHPRHGIHDPVVGTLAQAAGSVRRTSSLDSRRPQGLFGPLHIHGAGRDRVVHPDGSIEIVGHATCEAEIEFDGHRRLRSLTTEPDIAELVGLVGEAVYAGFRGSIRRLAPTLDDDVNVLYQLLDDIPAAFLVSGYAYGYAGKVPPGLPTGPQQHPDLCSGFRAGGTIMATRETEGHNPVVTGPLAGRLDDPDDPDAWHELASLQPGDMRRLRRTDVIALGPSSARVDAWFRDSHIMDDGREQVIHEYTIDGTVDLDRQVFTTISAAPRSLPWVECDSAAESTARLAGTTFGDLRSRVRAEFTGITTCTHLNDMMRTLADVEALAALIPRVDPSR